MQFRHMNYGQFRMRGGKNGKFESLSNTNVAHVLNRQHPIFQ